MSCANVIAIQNQNHVPPYVSKLACKAWVVRTISFLLNSITPTNALPLSKSRNYSRASSPNTTPYVSMQSSQMSTTTQQLLGSLPSTTFHHGVFSSFQKNTCWTCVRKTKGSLNSYNMWQKFASKNPTSFRL